MNLLIMLLGIAVSPADSARALISIRDIPEAAILYAQMAAVENGTWLLEYGRLLEADRQWIRASNAYGLALAGTSDQNSSRWLLNRIQGCSVLDTTLVITVTVANSGTITARDLQVIIPMPEIHPPYQEMLLLQNDFSISAGVLYAQIPCLEAGETKELEITLKVHQEPWSARPVTFSEMSQSDLSWLSSLLKEMVFPSALPGPCVPVSSELSSLAAERGIDLTVTGGLILDGDSCLFHAWTENEANGLRIDPVLFASDSLLGFAHNPTDVIPLWNMEPTDCSEITVLYSNPDYLINCGMTAKLQ
ncbi:hypothetical protein CSA37_00335 [Candidatus Fermentibacteria bacterium]|nr:MAG: hypothetical protein CSA37_00335 [Candidatus Fermentibacteria bacterium]